MRFGIEIEAKGFSRIEVVELLATAGIVCHDLDYSHEVRSTWKVVRDGSLGSNSFELVSPPLEYNETSLALVKQVANLLNDAGADVDRRCGLHVHFEVSNLEPQHVANVYNRYRKFEQDIDTTMPPSRRSNMYCGTLRHLPEMQPKQDLLSTLETVGQHGRYFKINLASFVKYGTIEFRQHGGSINGTKICNWIKFLAQFIEASRPTEVVVEEQPQAPIIEWITNTNARQSYRATGKTRQVLVFLETRALDGVGSATARRIAEEIGSTAASVQSIICRARRAGFEIQGSSSYSVTFPVIEQTVQRPPVRVTRIVSAQADSVWTGIDQSLVRYYARRIQVLAA